HAAYNRIEAARIVRTFPVVLDRLADGSVNLTTLRLVAAHLRPDNHVDVLAQAAGLGKREVEALVARLAPRPDVAASVRKLPDTSPDRSSSRTPPPPSPAVTVALTESPRIADAGELQISSSERRAVADHANAPIVRSGETPASHRAIVTALAPERYRVQFTIGRETYEKLRLAQDLLRREIPDGDLAAFFDRGLTLQLEEAAKRKLGATSKPRPGRTVPGSPSASAGDIKRSRHIPAEIKRKVWLRDQGRCAFIARGGRRCAERAYLEFHHVEPYAIGGETTVRNISLRCRSHNAHEAELAFGSDLIAGKKMSAGDSTRSGTSSKGGTQDPSPTLAASPISPHTWGSGSS
ncbi:MAG TPA: hypothetical protein VGK93_12685, partial [Candidatus Eisenbacteria bacterium]